MKTVVNLQIEFTAAQLRRLQRAAEFLGCPPAVKLSAESVTVRSCVAKRSRASRRR